MIAFSEQVKMIRNGGLDMQITEELADCVRTVDEEGGTATLTLRLTIKRAGDNSGYVAVTDEVTKKLPKKPASKSILFATPEGTLWEDNPRQGKIFDTVQKIADDTRKCAEQIGGRIVQPVEVVDRETGNIITINTGNHMN